MTNDAKAATVQRWAQLFNDDVEAMVRELYSPECVVNGAPLGHEKLLRFERKVLDAAPKRAIRVERTHTTDDVAVVEGTLLDPDQGDDWALPFCAVLTISDGRIVADNTYADYSRWPGFR